MRKPWLAALLNFFFMGLGLIYNGKRRITGLLLTLAALGLTYLENFHVFADGNNLSDHDQTAYMTLFACVFLANTGMAIDGYKEAQSINNVSVA